MVLYRELAKPTTLKNDEIIMYASPINKKLKSNKKKKMDYKYSSPKCLLGGGKGRGALLFNSPS